VGELPVRSARLHLVAVVGALAPLDVVLVGPALPAVAEAFGVSSGRAGLVITAYAVPGIVAAPLVGRLADRVGRRPVVVASTLLYGLTGLAVAAVPVDLFPVVLGLRALQGVVGGSILASLALTLAGDYFEGPTRNAAVGYVSAVITVSVAVVPLVGGALAAVSWRAVFLAYGASVVVSVVVAVALPEPAATEGGDLPALSDLRSAVPVGPALGVYGVGFVGYALFFGGLLTATPFLLSGEFGLGTDRIGALLTAASLVGAAVALGNGRLARYRTSVGLLLLAFPAYAVGLALAGSGSALPTLGAGLVAFSVGHGLLQPSFAASVAELGPARARGALMSLRTSVILAAQAVGPLAFTAPSAVAGGTRPLLVAGGVAAAVVAGGGWVARAARR
jgi:MFS family permease